MTITLHLVGALRSKRNRKLISRLLAKGFSLNIAR